LHIKSQQYTDFELLHQYKLDGNKEWLGILLSRYTVILLGVCNKYLNNPDNAKDIVQQVFLKAITLLELHQIENIGGWLYSIAKNACLDEIRKNQKTRIENVEDVNLNNEIDDFDLSLHQQDEFKIQKLYQAIESLKIEQKKCIQLFYIEEKSYKEIATLLNCEIKTVKSNIQNGKRNLKIILEQYNFGK
jgi:RNA polymerase sigma factor (sigma-70 family)